MLTRPTHLAGLCGICAGSVALYGAGMALAAQGRMPWPADPFDNQEAPL